MCNHPYYDQVLPVENTASGSLTRQYNAEKQIPEMSSAKSVSDWHAH